ncbi:hypothetical protein BGZ65_012051, partial [Modicella reniformis]
MEEKHTTSNKKAAKPGKKTAKPPVWSVFVKGLPGSAYFLATEPQLYDFRRYLEYIKARSVDRQKLSSTWRSVVLPWLTTSQLPVLRDAGARLEKEWARETAAHDQFWSRLEETEQEEKQQRKSMSTLKAQAYERFDAVQDLIVAETKAASEKAKKKVEKGDGTASSLSGSDQGPPRTASDDAATSPSDGSTTTSVTRPQTDGLAQANPEAWELLMRAAVLK